MTNVGSVGGSSPPDPMSAVRAIRQAMTAQAARSVDSARSAAVAAALNLAPGASPPSARVVLAAMQSVLRHNITSAGGLDSLVRRLVTRLAEAPETAADADHGAEPAAGPTSTGPAAPGDPDAPGRPADPARPGGAGHSRPAGQPGVPVPSGGSGPSGAPGPGAAPAGTAPGGAAHDGAGQLPGAAVPGGGRQPAAPGLPAGPGQPTTPAESGDGPPAPAAGLPRTPTPGFPGTPVPTPTQPPGPADSPPRPADSPPRPADSPLRPAGSTAGPGTPTAPGLPPAPGPSAGSPTPGLPGTPTARTPGLPGLPTATTPGRPGAPVTTQPDPATPGPPGAPVTTQPGPATPTTPGRPGPPTPGPPGPPTPGPPAAATPGPPGPPAATPATTLPPTPGIGPDFELRPGPDSAGPSAGQPASPTGTAPADDPAPTGSNPSPAPSGGAAAPAGNRSTTGGPPAGAAQTLDQVRAVLPTSPAAQQDLLTGAVDWLVENLDRPMVVTEGCTQLGPVLARLGLPPERLEAMAMLLAETMRAGVGTAWSADQHEAWSQTSRLVARWLGHGGVAAEYLPPVWTGKVIEHDLRRQDLAVLRVRTFLPYPYLPGQYATVETELLPQTWRPCWIAAAPRLDNTVELHVRAEPGDRVGAALVGRVTVGDRLRFGPALGVLISDPDSTRDLLLIADDTGIAPARALVSDLRERGDRRPVHLWWKVPPGEEPYDLAAVEALAGPTTDIQLLRTIAELSALLDAPGPWRECDVCVAGTRTGIAAATTLLGYAGIGRERIRTAEIGWDG